MNNELDTAVGLVKEHLETHQYSYGRRMLYLRCYKLLGEYLSSTEKQYSTPLARQWLQNIAAKVCGSTRNAYRMALAKLDEAYHRQEISDTNTRSNTLRQRSIMESWCKDALDSFMGAVADGYNSSYPYTIRSSVVRFLNYLTGRGVTQVEEISHRLVADYNRDDEQDGNRFKELHNCCIRAFLRYLSEHGRIQGSIPIALEKFVFPRLVFIEDLSDGAKAEFAAASKEPATRAVEYYNKSLEISALLAEHRYGKTMSSTFPKAWKELYVFLEANSLEYSLEMALAWANHMRHHTVQWECFRRAFMLFEQYRANGRIDPRITYRYQPDRADALPEWCRADYLEFIELRKADGLAGSTLAMSRSSCLRLLEYLCANHVSSWDNVTSEKLKTFHSQDIHSTAEAKNAYSSKIRIFLEHLGEKGLVPPALFMAIPSEFAPKVGIIKTLDSEDIAELYQFKEDAVGAYKLRETAMIIIGLRMGLRASDITKIKFADISWEQGTVSIQQQKTGKFLKLPMPVDAGNALYRYIIHGRPDALSEYVFITHRVPYGKLHRSACGRALSKALPDNMGGFHITRKTFASRMLANGVPAGRISETLGHTNNSTAMQYLSTDDEKMRQCALPLARIPVRGGALL